MEEEKISLDLLPVDIYEDEDLKTEIKNIVAVGKSVIKTPRYYNGVLPSSNYPGFSESRVNLIE